MRSNGQRPDGWEQRLPRQQQNQTSVPAEPAIPPLSNAGLRLIDKNGIDSVLADLRARGQA